MCRYHSVRGINTHTTLHHTLYYTHTIPHTQSTQTTHTTIHTHTHTQSTHTYTQSTHTHTHTQVHTECLFCFLLLFFFALFVEYNYIDPIDFCLYVFLICIEYPRRLKVLSTIDKGHPVSWSTEKKALDATCKLVHSSSTWSTPSWADSSLSD